ncbi:hypothetical protein A2U01_0076340, partial [Trifolium medium]|nr:hypothetical protein [Trifolium medium]
CWGDPVLAGRSTVAFLVRLLKPFQSRTPVVSVLASRRRSLRSGTNPPRRA